MAGAGNTGRERALHPDRLCAACGALFVAGLAAALAGFWDPPRLVAALPVLCPFRLLTGMPCPGCGMGHAVAALMAADFGAAWRYHPFSPWVTAGVLAWPLLPERVRRGRGAAGPRAGGIAAALCGALIAWWVAARLL